MPIQRRLPKRTQKKRKTLTSKGWSALAPSTPERSVMQQECGSKCFLGPAGENSFPICAKNTCTVNEKGIYAAYVRAREYGSPKMRSIKRTKKVYQKIASKAKTLLKKRGYGPNLN